MLQTGPWKARRDQNGQWVVGTENLTVFGIHPDVLAAPGDGTPERSAQEYAERMASTLNFAEAHNGQYRIWVHRKAASKK